MGKKVLFLGDLDEKIVEKNLLEMSETAKKSDFSVNFDIILVGGAVENALFIADKAKKYGLNTEIYWPNDQKNYVFSPILHKKYPVKRSYPLEETLQRLFSEYIGICFVGKTEIDPPQNEEIEYIYTSKRKRDFVAWDLEIANTNIPKDFSGNLFEYSPLYISCGAIAYRDREDGSIKNQFWQGDPHMTKETALDMLQVMKEFVDEGRTLLSFNGAQFDFKVLAQITGKRNLCAQLALNHYDIMYDVFLHKGYFVGLDSVLKFHDMGKVHKVTLSDGKVLPNMDGSKAPELWKEGEKEAVLEYLRGDVDGLLKVAEVIEERNKIEWYSRKGNYIKVPTEMLLVKDGLEEIKEPNNSWMEDPVTREDTLEWMEKD